MRRDDGVGKGMGMREGVGSVRGQGSVDVAGVSHTAFSALPQALEDGNWGWEA